MWVQNNWKRLRHKWRLSQSVSLNTFIINMYSVVGNRRPIQNSIHLIVEGYLIENKSLLLFLQTLTINHDKNLGRLY